MILNSKGFTIVELIISIAIMSILSAIVLFSIVQYINKGKDSNISGNLAVLVPAGEAYYNIDNTYEGFCDSPALINVKSQMPKNPASPCYNEETNPSGVCCNVVPDGYAGQPEGSEWMACAAEFTNSAKAFCVDFRGVKVEISKVWCQDGGIFNCIQ